MMLALMCWAPGALAEMRLSRSIVEFSPGQRLQNIDVLNAGNETLYISADALEVINPEQRNPKRQALKDPRTAPLLVTPNRLVLKPGQRKAMRLALRQAATDKDRVFRVSVIPNLGKVTHKGDGKSVNSAIKLVVGYDVLVIARPQGFEPKLQVSRKGKLLKLSNVGNSSVFVRQVKHCQTPESCIDVASNRLYAGERWQVLLPGNGPVELHQSIAGKNSVTRVR